MPLKSPHICCSEVLEVVVVVRRAVVVVVGRRLTDKNPQGGEAGCQ